ncbi:MAG: Bug family tripartite tricarboxylate transporter substrate binding protein [Gammaproteobacteria bacterium]
MTTKSVLLLLLGTGFMLERAAAQDDELTILTTYNATGFVSRALQIMEPRLEEYFEQPVEIEFGASTDVALAAPNDGSTFYVSTVGNMALLPAVSPSFSFNPLTDMRPVTSLVLAPDVLIVNSGLGIQSLDELVAYSNENPGALNYSPIAPRSIHRIEFAALLAELDIDAELNSTARGAARSMEGVSDGSVDLVITTSPYVGPVVEDGSTVPLAVAHPTRMHSYPDAPTLLERGVDSVPHGSWAGAFVPLGTSDDAIERIVAAIRFAMDDTRVIAEINALGMDIMLDDSPAEFAEFIRAEQARLNDAADLYGITMD